jgi:Holliday junction resolvase-like predicted endonuclease
MKKLSISTKKLGDQFEQEIADLYKAMGYEVKQHVPLGGQEVDVLATKYIPGVGDYSVIVECKYKGGTDRAGNEDVQSIVGAFNTAKAGNLASACTIVTTNGYSLSAQQVAETVGIHLTTKQHLIKGLIDFSPYIQRLKDLYYQDFGDKDKSWYIDPNVLGDSLITEPLDGFVDAWLVKSDGTPLVILGSYGTGKTSFCRHYAVRLIEKQDNLIPVLINLRDLNKVVRIESLVRDFLDEQCNAASPRFDTFWRMYTEGFLLLLFDGFDEMASRVDSSTLEANLAEIERFSKKVGKVILTCRTEHFISSSEEVSALSPDDNLLSDRTAHYRKIEISLWSREHISVYIGRRAQALDQHSHYSPADYINLIESLPELSDMSARAVHLDLIVKALPSMVRKGIPITRANLYQTYIQKELRRETIHNKRLQLISDEERLNLLRVVAARRFIDSHESLEFESAKKIIKDEMRLPDSDVEAVTRDFLNRSFLQRNGDVYRFAHKTLAEYLFACELFHRIQRGNLEWLHTVNYSPAVAGMILDLFGGKKSLNKFLVALNLELGSVSVTKDNWLAISLVCYALTDYIDSVNTAVRSKWNRKDQTALDVKHDPGPCRKLKNEMTPIIIGAATLRNSACSSEKMSEVYVRMSRAWSNIICLIDEV